MAVGKHTILIVDNDDDWLSLLERILSSEGYDVLKAQDCAGALNVMSIARPNCVIADLKLGAESGMKICAHMRASETLGAIPVIVLSGGDDPGPHDGARCDAFVCKADGTGAILAAIKKVLKN